MAKSHHDKIAVISGGANGIGQAFAQRLAQDGAHIVIADVAPGGDTVKMVEQAARHALACKCDVSSEDSVGALAGQVNKRFGRCDILINCAGIFPNQPFDEITFADWRRVQAINLDSVFLMSAAFAPSIETAPMGTHRQHVIEHTRLSGEWVRTLHGEQGRHRRYHAGVGQ
jgi:NAD(P)-dependent dehydrogenase (short-subunit alcohol dehydrogenase family)